LAAANNKPGKNNSAKTALSGIIISLSVFIMFLTRLVPTLTYAMPAIAGFLMVVLVIETDLKTALVAYAAASLLILIVTPDTESYLMYVFFFGYYCILKAKLERIRKRWLEIVIKILVFNIAVAAAYSVFALLLGIDKLMESFGDFGRYSLLVFLLIGNIIFIIYDFAISNLIEAYIKVIRPKFLKKPKGHN
jgi:hypothetical protein